MKTSKVLKPKEISILNEVAEDIIKMKIYDKETIEEDKREIIVIFSSTHFQDSKDFDDDLYKLSNIIRELKEY